MPRSGRLQTMLWLSHGLVLIAAALGIATAELGSATARAMLLVIAAAPMLAAVPGLRRQRRYTYQWLTVVLIMYIGVAAVEVVATLGASVYSSITLFAALLELGLLLRLIRSPAHPRRAAPRE